MTKRTTGAVQAAPSGQWVSLPIPTDEGPLDRDQQWVMRIADGDDARVRLDDGSEQEATWDVTHGVGCFRDSDGEALEVTAVWVPAPRKRFGGPSGKPGKHRHPRLPPIHAPVAFRALLDKAIEHNAESKNDGGYAGFSDWARHHLAIAAADELGIDPMEALRLLD